MFIVFQQHETIHATVKARDVEIVKPKIEIGKVYEIRQFFVDNNKQKYRVVPHTAMLQLTRATIFTAVAENTSSIPLNKFNFSEYDQLPSKINNTTVLTGEILYILILIQISYKFSFI